MSMSDSAEMAREPLDKVDEELQTVASLVRLSIKNQQQHQQLQRHGWGDSHKVQDAAGAFDCSGDAERRFQALKAEVQQLARVVDSRNSSLASTTSGHLGEVNRLAAQAARCKSVITALDGLIQADECLTSSQQLLMKNDYVAAAAAISRAETLLLELQQAEANAASPSAAVGRGWGGSGKENRPNHAADSGSGVLRALRRLLLKRRTDMERHLREVTNASVELGKDGTTVRCQKILSGMVSGRHFRTPVPLSAVFDSLAKLNLLSDIFREFSRRLRTDVIDPLLVAKHVPPPKRYSDNATASLVYAPAASNSGALAFSAAAPSFEKMKISETVKADPGIIAELLSRVTRVLEFLHEEVMGGQRSLTAAMGASLLSEPDGLGQELLSKLEDHVPHSAAQLEDFERGARDACLEFENRLMAMGYFGEEQRSEQNATPEARAASMRNSLSRFVDTVDVRFAAKRRRSLLHQARNSALGDYHNSVEVSDALEGLPLARADSSTAVAGGSADKVSGMGGNKQEDSASKTFRLERCQVSTVAKGLVALIRSTLLEACSEQVPPLCAKELFRTARDMLDLFRAVVPVQHASALDGVPRIAAVFHNDCLYLAHHMVTLGYEFRPGLPHPANRTATMVDTVPLFREMAAQSLSEQLRRQQGQLEEFFSRVDVLKSTEGAASLLDAADSAFEGIFLGGDDPARAGPGGRMVPGLRRGVGDDSKAFGGLGARAGEEGDAAAAVRKSAYHLRQLKQAWWRVLPDRVYRRVMGALLSQVARKLSLPVLGATDLGVEQTHALHRIFKVLGDAAEDVFESGVNPEQHTPGWAKSVVVGQMMELGLEAIGEMLQGDAFHALTAGELSGLIKAIFQDTPARASVLAAVAHDSQG